MSPSEIKGPISQNEIQAEIDRLLQMVQHLEAAQVQARQTIQTLQAELEQRKMYAELAKQFPPEDWKDFDPKDYTIPVEQLLAEADALKDS
jgi:hypothetical protein